MGVKKACPPHRERINISGVFRRRTNWKQPLPSPACPNTQWAAASLLPRPRAVRCLWPAARPVPRRAIGCAVRRSRPAPARREGTGGRAASPRSTRKLRGRPPHRSRPLRLPPRLALLSTQRPPTRSKPPAVLAPLKAARAWAGANLARARTAPRARGLPCRRRPSSCCDCSRWAAAALTAPPPGGWRPGGRPTACGTLLL